MFQVTIQNFEEYIEDCTTLLKDLYLAIKDLEYQDNGGEIRYAIDFSEIFAYIFISQKTLRNFALFPSAYKGENEQENIQALQQLTLNHILFNLGKKPILLPPYLIEFQGFVRAAQNKEFEDLVSAALRMFGDIEQIGKEKIDTEIEHIYSKLASSRSLTEKEAIELTNFVEKYGHIYSLLVENKNINHPYRRALQVSPQKAFEALEDLISLKSPIQKHVYERWVEQLYQLRQKYADNPISSRLDATAINLLYEVNHRFKEEGKTKLLLVTRSRNMREIFEKELEEGLWAETGNENLLRHPRVFMLIIAAKHSGTRNGVADLKILSKTIETFLISNKIIQEDEDAIDKTHLENDLKKILSDWRGIQNIALTLRQESLEKTPISEINLSIQAGEIIRLIKNRQEILDRLNRQLDKLLNELEDTHKGLGLDIELLKSEMQFPEGSKKTVHLSGEGDKVIVASSSLGIPYSLLFYAEPLKEKMAEIHTRGINLRESFELFKQVFQEGAKKEIEESDLKELRYEYFLAMSYILGLLGKWKIARDYCQRAVEIGKDEYIGEGFYFLSICERKCANSASDLKKALVQIEQAIASHTKEPKTPNRNVRFIKEKGTLILDFNLRFDKQAVDIAPKEVGIGLLEGLVLLDNDIDPRLRLDIYNNLLYFYVETKTFLEKTKSDHIRKLFVKFVSELQNMESDKSKWPASFLDTVAWSDWVINFDTIKYNLEKKSQLIYMLSSSLEKSMITENEKKEVKKHLDAINDDKREAKHG